MAVVRRAAAVALLLCNSSRGSDRSTSHLTHSTDPLLSFAICFCLIERRRLRFRNLQRLRLAYVSDRQTPVEDESAPPKLKQKVATWSGVLSAQTSTMMAHDSLDDGPPNT